MSEMDAQTAQSDATPAAANFIVFTEGRVQLPEGYEDRTTNILVPANLQTQPNLSIARDWMKATETLTTYVDRQLGVLKSQLASHKLIARQRIRLGAAQEQPLSSEEVLANWPPAIPEVLIEGERIDATYKSGKQTLFQRQAAFEVAPLRVLVFTATSQQPFTPTFEGVWNDWLASFVPAAQPSASEEQNSALGQSGDATPSGA